MTRESPAPVREADSPTQVFPFVSVVVPVRNGERSLDACLGSLAGQDYPAGRHEILVVDNGSTDRTPEIIDSYPVRHLQEPQRGVSHARNRGIEEAQGEIVAFLDGDCTADPTWLRGIADPFGDPQVGCVAGELRHIEPTTPAERQAKRLLGRWQQFAFSSKPPYAITANAAYRREVFEVIGRFDPKLPRAQDVEIGLRFHAGSPLRLAYGGNAIARHQHRPTQLGFFRQQLGWAYGAGLVGAKFEALGGDPVKPPRIREITKVLRGLSIVAWARIRGRGQPGWIENAYYDLIRQIAWFVGARVGLRRGAKIWQSG